MPLDLPLIAPLVAGLVLAFVFGAIASRLRMPPLIGYLVAGLVVAQTPGFATDPVLATHLAEIGVVLLLFGVGLHVSLRDLLNVRAAAVTGAAVRIAVATALGAGLGLLLGWDLFAALIFGIALSAASSVVLLKTLQERRLKDTEHGRVATAWLVVENLAMVLALVLIPAVAAVAGAQYVGFYDPYVAFVERLLSTEIGLWGVLALTLVKIVAFAGFMLVVGRRVIPWALHVTAQTGSRELFRLGVLAIALGIALGTAELFSVPLALGAFLAGLILSESELSNRAARETLPLREAFSVLFFVGLGMLFDPAVLVSSPLPLLAVVLIIVVARSVAGFAVGMLFRHTAATGLTVSAGLAQIGEFSFVLASMGVALAILPPEGRDLILAGALISILLNPLVFFILERARPGIEARVPGPRIEPGEPVPDGPVADTISRSGHIVLVGFGRVGSVVGEGLLADGADLLVIEDASGAIEAARAMGIAVIPGNAADPTTLDRADIGAASQLIVTGTNVFEAGQIIEQSRKRNAGLRIVARVRHSREEDYLGGLGADVVIMGEREIGFGLLAWVRGKHDRVPEPHDAPAPAPAGTELPEAVLVPLGAAAQIEPEPPVPETSATPEAEPVGAGLIEADFEPPVPEELRDAPPVDLEPVIRAADPAPTPEVSSADKPAPEPAEPRDEDDLRIEPRIDDAGTPAIAPDMSEPIEPGFTAEPEPPSVIGAPEPEFVPPQSLEPEFEAPPVPVEPSETPPKTEEETDAPAAEGDEDPPASPPEPERR